MPDQDAVSEAAKWLSELYRDLMADPYYEKSGEDFLARIEWEIRRYSPKLQEAIRTVLGHWLLGEDSAKADLAADLIGRLHAIEHISTLEELRKDLIAGRSSTLPIWLVDAVLRELRDADEEQAARGGSPN